MKATVIIPAYNAGKTIGQCLGSLEKQPFKDFETIVVDDGSSDKTSEIASKFAWVRLLSQKKAGPATARNKGAKNSKGQILVFLDSDCVAEKNWLAEMVKPFKNPKIAGVQGKYENKQKEFIARFIHLEIEQRYEKMAKHDFIDFIGSYSAAYRKSVFNEMNGFDTTFPMASGEDTDLSFRISKKGYKMVFNPKAIVYHFHPISLQKYLKVKFFRALWRTKIYQKHKSKIIKDTYTSQVIKLQTLLFYLSILSLATIPLGFNSGLYTVIFFSLLFISTLPFAAWAFRKDPAVAILSPVLSIGRTAMFCFGLAIGIANHVRGKT